MSNLPFRAVLASLPNYVPGRTIPGAIKLASNEAPEGPLPSVVSVITEAAGQVNRYPDMSARDLINRVAEKFDVSAEHIAVGCGSVSICQQFIQALCEPEDEVLFAWRSFEAYPIITQVAGARPVMVPLTSTFEHDLDAMLAAITPRTKVIFVCTPNNPTGTVVKTDDLSRFVEQVPDNILIVLDEAYSEFVTDDTAARGTDFVARYPNVAVARTFSKAYGLAGLRVGYSIASPTITAAVGKVHTPFSINSIAQVAAIASLDAEDELHQRCKNTIAERDRVQGRLRELGYQVPQSQGNFVWLPLEEKTVSFAQHALEQKIVVRPFADKVNGGVRVTIGTQEENDAFLDVAASFDR